MKQTELNANSELGQIIITAAVDNGFEPHFNYSGRGMYGKICFGIVGSFANIGGFFVNVAMSCQEAGIDIEDFGDIVTLINQDNMGLDSIIYFPKLIIKEN